MKNLFTLSQLSVDEILQLLKSAESFRNGQQAQFSNKVVANLFFEPSTRTHYSFNMAELKLGTQVLNFNAESSSLKKGESLYDTVKTFESIGVDAVVIRHVENEYYKQLNTINCSIINGGDGTGNHPTQSLLDLMTIQQDFKTFKGLKVVIIGDVKHSRVAHTNIEVMRRLGMEVFVSGPKEFDDGSADFINVDQAISEMDVIMLLRVQHERHNSKMQLTVEEYHQTFGLTVERAKRMKKTAIILHPAPFNRGVEIADELVECKNSRIFKQIENGVFVRMAVLEAVLR